MKILLSRHATNPTIRKFRSAPPKWPILNGTGPGTTADCQPAGSGVAISDPLTLAAWTHIDEPGDEWVSRARNNTLLTWLDASIAVWIVAVHDVGRIVNPLTPPAT